MTINIQGRVIHGEHFGRQLGFPTANIDRRSYVRRKLKIRFGIYAGYAVIGNRKLEIGNYRAAIVIGPLDTTGLPKLEAHLIGFKGNLYGKKIVIELQQFIRPYKKFKNMNALQRQIGKDILKIKNQKAKSKIAS